MYIYLMVPTGHRQTVRDGQPVPVHLEVCGTTGIQSREVNKYRMEAAREANAGPTATVRVRFNKRIKGAILRPFTPIEYAAKNTSSLV